MRKSKRPPFQELIARLVNQIQIRNPDKQLGIEQISVLETKWKGFDEKLYKTVIALEINERKALEDFNKIDLRVVEFVVGRSISGEDIIVRHVIKFKDVTIDPKRYKKTGSKFTQELLGEASFQNILF
jgi:hypothetical protein